MKNLGIILTVALAMFWAGCGTDSTGKISYVTFDSTTNQPQLKTISADGKTTSAVNITIPTDAYFISVNPSASAVVYCRDTNNSTQIYLIGLDGKEKQLTNSSNGGDCVPSFSADGKKIVFESLRNNSAFPQIFIMNADGTGQKLVLATTAGTFYPQLSPDQKLITFYQFSSSVAGTHPADRAWTNEINMTAKMRGMKQSTVRPMGTVGDPTIGLYTVKVDGTGVKQVVSDPNGNVFPGVFSPDGRKLLFSTYQFNQNSQIASINLDGTGVVNLSNGTSDDFAPTVHGSQILFNRSVKNSSDFYFFDVFQMDANGANQKNLTNTTDTDEFLPGLLAVN